MDAVQIVSGTAVPLRRSDVDTDQIIPSDWLKRVERTGFDKGLFSEWRDNRDFVLNDERYSEAVVLVAGPNFGTGSSREHAVWAIQQYGFGAVVSPRFADIFRNNCTKNGLVPVQVSEEVGAALLDAVEADPDLVITFDVVIQDKKPRAENVHRGKRRERSRSRERNKSGAWVRGGFTRAMKSVVVSPARNASWRRVATRKSRLVATPPRWRHSSARARRAAASARVGP